MIEDGRVEDSRIFELVMIVDFRRFEDVCRFEDSRIFEVVLNCRRRGCRAMTVNVEDEVE